jgi:hypothetical protein
VLAPALGLAIGIGLGLGLRPVTLLALGGALGGGIDHVLRRGRVAQAVSLTDSVTSLARVEARLLGLGVAGGLCRGSDGGSGRGLRGGLRGSRGGSRGLGRGNGGQRDEENSGELHFWFGRGGVCACVVY